MPSPAQAVAASPIANLSPASLTFGTLAVGTTSGPQPITLRNPGSAALTLSQITFTGPDAASFAVAPTGTTCPIGSTVAIGANCLVQIAFAPQTSGAKNATVNFVDNASGSPQSISLSGTGHRTRIANFTRLANVRRSKRRHAKSIANDYAFQHSHQLSNNQRNHHHRRERG